MSAVGIPVSMVAPHVPPAPPGADHARRLLRVAYVGLGLAPVGGAWVWMVLSGIGSGMFPRR